ncbi:response regulator [Vibrio sp. CAU 1672]|uniref:response regulator n=1 Tax=Vibrio sp. CAU 1672 TaxID=3032594 RepID=UPI0023DA2589|nr:response regulator [Vibrio sp. CAU 1672]MDF2154538.1 response regulator [Vibrio sp. CAU 1672]
MPNFADIRIRTKLVSILVIIGVLPLLAATLFNGQLASKALIEQSFEELNAIQALRSKGIEDFFLRRMTDLELFVGSELTASLGAAESSGITNELLTSQNQFIEQFIRGYGYSDLLLISPKDGKIVYSRDNPQRVGNILTAAKWSDPALFSAWSDVLVSGQAVFSDFGYSELDEGQVAYIAAPVKNNGNQVTSIVAVKVLPMLINKIVDSREGMGETGESYLIGINRSTGKFEFRSDMVTMGDGKNVVGFRLKQDLDYWSDAQASGSTGGQNTYVDSAGRNVLVAFSKVKVPGHSWYLISKINQDEVTAPIYFLYSTLLVAGLVLVIVVIFVAMKFSNSVTKPLIEGMSFANDIASGKLDSSLEVNRSDELGKLAQALNEMSVQLRELDWLKSGKEDLDDQLRGDLELSELAKRFISFFSKHMASEMGALYLYDQETQLLTLQSSYAFTDRNGNFNTIKLGEGMVGQAAMEQEVICYSDISHNAPLLNYGAGEVVPPHFMAIPLVTDSHLIGVALLGSLTPFTKLQKQYVNEASTNAAVVFGAANARTIINQLLERAQKQQENLTQANSELEEQATALRESERALQTQQEELRVTNEELEEQTKVLKESEAELQAQQEELRVTNEELEERTKALEDQKLEMQEKNDELHLARQVVEEKAKELEVASKYKSEFLANMSHELRTPLNSILILSQLFANNKDGNLTDKQIESARAINSSGADLLSLINEILDLSKVEAGKIELHIEDVAFDSIEEDINRLYADIAAEKGLEFSVSIAGNLPGTIETDSQRLQQILRNLLTNAFKFTHDGSVSLSIAQPSPEMAVRMNKPRESLVAFQVKDDGIGIKEEQQLAIFQAFQQADGSTSRKYGGTGLGLSISKELTHLLGGNILVKSEEGKGSTFTVVLPLEYVAKHTKESEEDSAFKLKPAIATKPDNAAREASSVNTTGDNVVAEKSTSETLSAKVPDVSATIATSYIDDDRQTIAPEDKTLLIIEDDKAFAGVMRDFGRERGFKCIVAETGEIGLHFADYYKPSAIILDIGLPGIDGWTVMERLKETPELRHIPVHFMSANDANLDAMRMGAIGYLTKPVNMQKLDAAFSSIEDIISKPVKRLLIVEDDEIQRDSIKQLIGQSDVHIVEVSRGEQALAELESHRYDCMILDLGLEDMTGFELLEGIRRSETAARVPIIVYTGRELTRDEEKELNQYAESIIIKGVKSPERLLDESALFLHRVEAELPAEQRGMLKAVHDKESVLKDKNILLVDDDMRNVFALSRVLEEKGMNVTIARDGLESLDKLKENPAIDLVLMDIMMPKMDGYEAMQEIRSQKKYASLPIIALTAKAMKGDRSKCIEAGASDYLAKPVDTDKLLSMMRVWLY